MGLLQYKVTKMSCKIHLRIDQSLSQRGQFASEKASVFAPGWVRQGLKSLGPHLKGKVFNLYDNTGTNAHQPPSESFTITQDFNQQSLLLLQKVARSEPFNVDGIINAGLYPEIPESVYLSLRDLVRQCVIVGIDSSTYSGGYLCPRQVQPRQKVYICDLAALQFQQQYNSGRQVLIQKDNPYQGVLDTLIFENVVGEKKRTFNEVTSAWNSDDMIQLRYIPHDGYGPVGEKSCFIDARAYSAFVRKDVVLFGNAVCAMVRDHSPNDKILLKFLKYGCGNFAAQFADELEKLILPAVLDGLELLLKDEKIREIVRQIELPFYNCDQGSVFRVKEIQNKYRMEVNFSKSDALSQPGGVNLVVATTNCGDSHACCGNEMGFSSVNAAIAENIDSRGNILCPNINLKMKEKYIETVKKKAPAPPVPPSAQKPTATPLPQRPIVTTNPISVHSTKPKGQAPAPPPPPPPQSSKPPPPPPPPKVLEEFAKNDSTTATPSQDKKGSLPQVDDDRSELLSNIQSFDKTALKKVKVPDEKKKKSSSGNSHMDALQAALLNRLKVMGPSQDEEEDEWETEP